MNAVKIYENAKWRLEHNEITLGEFEETTKPLEDVREDTHGEWRVEMEYGMEVYTCSECGFESANKSNFCPNCGADMRGETE